MNIPFIDKVIGNKQCPLLTPNTNLFKEKLARIEFDEGNNMKPMVHIHKYVFEGLYAPWEDTLVVKLLGKKVGFNVTNVRLPKIWKLSAGFYLLDIGNGYSMVKFDVEDDRTRVMEDGP